MNNNIDEMIDEALDAKAKKKALSQWYKLRPILGYFNWANSRDFVFLFTIYMVARYTRLYPNNNVLSPFHKHLSNTYQ